MGQKVNPIGIRLAFNKDWNSKWYDKKNYAQFINEDINLTRELKRALDNAAIAKVTIERLVKKVKVTIYSARPGSIIGWKKGGGLEGVRTMIAKLLGVSVHLNIEEIRKPELDSTLVAENIAKQLEQRVMFRRAMKRAVTSALKSGAKGIKICVSGRLGGAEIARSEWYREGRIPLHTLRADIDYGTAEAKTTYGIIGVKVWIFKGEILTQKNRSSE